MAAKNEAKIKKTETELEPTGKQLDLIDVAPAQQKKIAAIAKNYKKAQQARIAALKIEVDEKQRLLELIKQANLQHLEGNKVQFRADGLLITVTSRDELVSVKDESESAKE